MSDSRPTRRGVLAAGAATAVATVATVAGCGRAAVPGAAGASGSSTSSPASPAAAASAAATSAADATTVPNPAAPATWALQVASAESSLVASYDVVVKAHPALKATLAPLRAAHAAHLKAVKAPGHGKAIAGLPTSQAEALSRLAAAEQKASDSTATACVTCPTEAAALLGSIAAADASHVLVLQSIGSK